jgi:RNA-directed DNA polymerase
MDGKQQKNRFKSTLNGGERGEALQAPAQGSEPSVAENENGERRTDRMMEEILERENLKAALQAVLKNKGAPGVDGMTVEALTGYLKENYARIRAQLLEGKYAPQPVRRLEIPKAGGGVRKLGVPTVVSFCTSCSFLLG